MCSSGEKNNNAQQVTSIPDDVQFGTLQDRWCADSAVPCPDNTFAQKQSHWDKPLMDRDATILSSSVTYEYHRARLRAVASPPASDWLFALPIAACSLRLDDETVRVPVGLRLGVNICEHHECRCEALVKANGSHGLSCSIGATPDMQASYERICHWSCSHEFPSSVGATGPLESRDTSFPPFYVRPSLPVRPSRRSCVADPPLPLPIPL